MFGIRPCTRWRPVLAASSVSEWRSRSLPGAVGEMFTLRAGFPLMHGQPAIIEIGCAPIRGVIEETDSSGLFDG